MTQYDPKQPSRINFVSVTLTLAILGASYWGWFYVPHWLPVMRLKQPMNAACNQAYREFDNRKIMNWLAAEAAKLNPHYQPGHFKLERVPYKTTEMGREGVDKNNTILRMRGKECIITFHFEVEAKWPLVDKYRHIVFHRQVHKDLKSTNW